MNTPKKNTPAATGTWSGLEASTRERPCSVSQPGASSHSRQESQSAIQTICLGDVAPTPIQWLWEEWMAAGKLHLIAGAPGTGKTTIALHLAAVVSSGGCWPDGSRYNGGVGRGVVIWSGEDDLRDTIAPRLRAAGAEMTKIHSITQTDYGNGSRAFDPARDITELAAKCEELGDIGLIVFDPIASAVSGDGHKNGDVRRGLQPLVDLAMHHGCALLGVTHFSKSTQGRSPLERVTGSIAFGALARIVLATVKPSEHDQPSRLVRSKSNLGPDQGGFEYRLVQRDLEGGFSASVIEWGEQLEGSALELINDAEGGQQGGPATSRVRDWLQKRLADGPVASRTLKEEAASVGYAWRTVQRARLELRYRATRHGFSGESYTVWEKPGG